MLYILFFSLGFGPIPWAMNGEIFSPEAKGPASSIAGTFNWACAFIVAKFSTNLMDVIGTHGLYYAYGVICALAVVFVAVMVPETKGKSQQEIKNYFLGAK